MHVDLIVAGRLFEVAGLLGLLCLPLENARIAPNLNAMHRDDAHRQDHQACDEPGHELEVNRARAPAVIIGAVRHDCALGLKALCEPGRAKDSVSAGTYGSER